MKHNETVLLFVRDVPNDFYTFTRLFAGYNFDTHRTMDLWLADGISSFLQVWKLQNPKANVEADARTYSLFSWDVVSLDPNASISEVPNPRIVLAIRAKDAITHAIHLRMLLESVPESKRTLEEWFSEVECDEPPQEPAKVSQTFNTTVYGAANLVGVVSDSQVTFNVAANELISLKQLLRSNKVSERDITELLTALQEDPRPTSTERFGPNVSSWVSKMIRKSCEGSWGVAIGAAGKLLADAISRYYGL